MTSPAEISVDESRAFEPEFMGPVPRAIPPEILDGPYAREGRRRVVVWASVGVLALLGSAVPLVQRLGLYILPLAYLDWIGVGAMLLAAIQWARVRFTVGLLAYVRDGTPINGRVTALATEPTHYHNGMPAAFAIRADVAVRHPGTGEIVVCTFRSPGFDAGKILHRKAPFRVGDHITVVYLPGRFDDSARVYAFLELSPAVSLRLPHERSAPISALKGVLAVTTFIAALVYAACGISVYEPLVVEGTQATTAILGGGLVVGALFAWAMARSLQKTARALDAVHADDPSAKAMLKQRPPIWLAVVVCAGLFGLSCAFAASLIFTANALFDTGPAETRPARVLRRIQTTHDGLFREYTLEYQLDGYPGKQSLESTPQHLSTFADERAVATIRPGRFGWPWVERVDPFFQAAPGSEDGGPRQDVAAEDP